MNHDALKDLISAYQDGQTSPAEAARAEAHLAECDECSAAAARWRSLGAGLAALRRPPEAGFTERVLRAVRSEPAPAKGGAWDAVGTWVRSWATPRWAVPALAAGLAALALLVRPPAPSVPVSTEAESFLEEILPTEDLVDGGSEDIGSDIETYFL